MALMQNKDVAPLNDFQIRQLIQTLQLSIQDLGHNQKIMAEENKVLRQRITSLEDKMAYVRDRLTYSEAV